MAGLINIGLTGLLSHQSALSTTGNNVTNANTPGYSRQTALFESKASQFSGAGYVGTGVSLADIQRMNSEFINQQLRNDSTLNGEQGALASELGRLDNLFGSETTGLSGPLSDFFAALHDAAESPDSIPQRQLVISRAEALAQRFNSLDNKLDQHQAAVEQQMESEVSRINGLAQSIADLNQAITSSPGITQGIKPNELMDQRDEKLRELSELVRIQVSPESGGQVNVAFGNGQTLVNGGAANQLTYEPGEPGEGELKLHSGASARTVTDVVDGGRLGGLLKFEKEGLSSVRTQLNAIANQLADKFNSVHGQGYDLDGSSGEELFTAAFDEADITAGSIAVNLDLKPRQLALADEPGGADGGQSNSLNNRNAQALADIQFESLDGLGEETLEDAYGLLVTEVGTETSRAQQAQEASETLLEQSRNSWQQQSGVNLDEEAGKLIQYQSAYNASAQVVSVARDLFDTLLSSFR